MSAAIALFTRDLRLRDNPALAAAAQSAHVVPLFVIDDAITAGPWASPNRAHFLVDCLHDLRSGLRRLGADLVVRRGDTVEQVMEIARQVGATEVHLADDVSAFAQRRQTRLEAAAAELGIDVVAHAGVTVVPPGAVVPTNGDHYRVFTPYLRAWLAHPWRAAAPTPRRLSLAAGIRAGRLPSASSLTPGAPSPAVPGGGEAEGRRLLRSWLRSGLARYDEQRDALAADGTSRLSAHLHFGTISPLEVALAARDAPGGAPFVRQLCWRDFFHQVTAAFPHISTRDYRPRGDRWRNDPVALAAWREGRTGYPIVDAGMRQLASEGWIHNRARLLVASFLVKDLRIDWRLGAEVFGRALVDGDVASNAGSWQWMAGTGNDTRPNRILNPDRQAQRFDPDGAYVRRYVPELSDVPGAAVHRPWALPAATRRALDYPDPIVDHDEAVARFRAERARS